VQKKNYVKRRDSKRRVLRRGESIRDDGLYQFKYYVNGKPKFVYSWRLESTDKLPQGRKPCLSLREMEKQIGYDLDSQLDPTRKNMTVLELVERYIQTKTGVRPNTRNNYQFVVNILKKEDFSGSFQLAGVVVNDSVTRQAITRDQMRKFLKFVHDDNVYCKYYEAVYILFHTGMRISEFCGLTIKDLDMENRVINIDHQLQRTSRMEYVIEKTKTNAGTRKIPMTEEVFRCFQAILEDREAPPVEKMVGGYTGFLYLDRTGMPEVAMHWEHRFNHMVKRYNEIYRVQMPPITPHVCRHTYCSNQAKAGMNPKTLQYLMGHSEIGVTLNTYTHLGLEDAAAEMNRMQEMEAARREQEKLRGTGEEKETVKRQMFKVF